MNIPVVSGALLPDLMYEGADNFYGTSGTLGQRRGNFILQNSDLIIAIGNSLASKQTGFNQELFAPYAKILMIEAFSEPFYGASLVASGAMRGTGDTFVPSVFKFVSMWCVRIPLAIFLRSRYGLAGVWAAMSFELFVRGVLFLIRLGGKKWAGLILKFQVKK